MQLENPRLPAQAPRGPDAVALPVDDRYRYGVVVGSVVTATGERGCNGEVWLEPEGAPVRDVRTIATSTLAEHVPLSPAPARALRAGRAMCRVPPVRAKVRVRIGDVVRAVVTMAREPAA